MFYFVRDLFGNNCRITDDEHLQECIKYAKHDWDVDKVNVNQSVICFDGYLVNGDYLGEF